MVADTAIMVGVLFACSVFLILQRSVVRILFGFVLFTNAANLLLLGVSGPPEGRLPPVVDGSGAPAVDPLPQALILTAIVIGFGVISYLVVLLYRLFLDHGTTSAGELFDPERKEKP